MWTLTATDVAMNPEAPFFWIAFSAAQALMDGHQEVTVTVTDGKAYIERNDGLPWTARTPVRRQEKEQTT